MTANGPTSDWPEAVIGFLSSNLPTLDEGDGWDHMFSTAYQIGCMALVALGQAEEMVWGAVPALNPRLPSVLPRWDDVCIAVLWLAHQQNKLAYRCLDGSVPPPSPGRNLYVVTVVGAPPPPPPNIAVAHGLGPARVTMDVLSVLEALSLVEKGRWTATAETVLWRTQPSVWDMKVEADPRFVEAVEQALTTMPEAVRDEMDRLVSITEEDVVAAVARYATATEEKRAKYGSKAVLERPRTPEMVRRGLEFQRRHDLNWLFFRHWRLGDGWLSAQDAERALEVFHDRLASAICRAVTTRRYPDMEFLANG